MFKRPSKMKDALVGNRVSGRRDGRGRGRGPQDGTGPRGQAGTCPNFPSKKN